MEKNDRDRRQPSGGTKQPSERTARPAATQVNVRLDDRLLARLDKLSDLYSLPGRPITRSDALRIATEAGLTVLLDNLWPQKVVDENGQVLTGAAAFHQLGEWAEADETEQKPRGLSRGPRRSP